MSHQLLKTGDHDDTNLWYARITPVDSRNAGRALNTWYGLWITLQAIVLGSAACLLPMVIWIFAVSILNASSEVAMLGFILLGILSYVACVVFGLGMACPPRLLDKQLCSRFLRSVELRAIPTISPFDPDTRVVELVPRQRWHKSWCLDTATDLMMIHVDDRGVWMKGDWYRYELPAESILSAHCEDYRSPGGFHKIFMVIICVRTQEGPIELPIAYRDHGWGTLRPSRRRDQAIQLSQDITAVAKGHLCQPPTPPVVGHQPPVVSWSTNPYAAPAMVDE